MARASRQPASASRTPCSMVFEHPSRASPRPRPRPRRPPGSRPARSRRARARPPWRRPRRRQPPPASRAAEGAVLVIVVLRFLLAPSGSPVHVVLAAVALDAEAVVVFLRRRGQERPRASSLASVRVGTEVTLRGSGSRLHLLLLFPRMLLDRAQLPAQALLQRDLLRALHGDLRVPRLRLHDAPELLQLLHLAPVRTLRQAARHARLLVAAVQLVHLDGNLRLEQQHLRLRHQVARFRDVFVHRPRARHALGKARERLVRLAPSLRVPPELRGQVLRRVAHATRARRVMGVAHVVIIQRALQRGDVRGRAGDPRRRVARGEIRAAGQRCHRARARLRGGQRRERRPQVLRPGLDALHALLHRVQNAVFRASRRRGGVRG